ncbi:hypothetical protein C8R44DRAFT_741486 [Mycena epipterygia]|nr:hypothetical protein C8R44DRAFT_741486 [Mycena epipterygia]
MSTGPTHDNTAPGGQLNCIASDLDRDNRSISQYTWSHCREPSQHPILLCTIHGPTDACDCEVTSMPTTPANDTYDDTALHTPTRPTPARLSGGSYDSDATVSESFHRPCADPHVSPVQLPPLCDEVDSDDELFADENTATPDPAADESVQQPVDEEHSDDDEQESSPPATQGLDILSWTAGLKQAVPDLSTEAEEALISGAFDFMLPSTAPAFPPQLHVGEEETRPRRLSPESLAGVLLLVTARNANRSRPRPSDTDLDDRYETDTALMEYLTHPNALDTNETKLHERIALRSKSASSPPPFGSSDPTSYAQAPHYIQRHVRQLLTQYPRFQADAITPTELPTPVLFHCIFPTCPHEVPRTRAAAEAHIKACHWPEPGALRTVPIKCPACPAKKGPIQAGSMGQHSLTHAAEREVTQTPSVRCKLCDCESTDMRAFVEHFRACQVPFTPLQARPHKRQRVDSGSGRSSDVRV